MKIPHNEVDKIVAKLNSFPARSKFRKRYAEKVATEYNVGIGSIYALQNRKKHGSLRVRENHPRAKFTNSQVLELRKLYEDMGRPRGFVVATAKKYKVGQSTVSSLLSGRTTARKKVWEFENNNTNTGR